jgi:hypothetical protein
MSYRENPAINQSRLVALSHGIGSYKFQKKEDFTPDPFLIGGAVDCLLTTPDQFEDRFIVSSDLTFTSKVAKIIKTVYDEVEKPAHGINHYEKELLEEAVIQDYGQKWKEGTVWGKIVEQNILWDTLCASEGRDIIGKNHIPIIDRCVDTLKNHPFSKKIINYDIDVEYQKEVYFKHRELDCKALLDKVIVNDLYCNLVLSDITIPPKSILPIDIKTIGQSVKSFPTSFRKYRYDVQSSWYMLALKKEYPNYNILPMLFVVVSTSTKEYPLIYKTVWDDLYIGKYGGKKEWNNTLSYKKYIKQPDVLGYEQMIDLYLQQLSLPEEVQFKYDYHIYKNNGIIEKSLWNEY